MTINEYVNTHDEKFTVNGVTFLLLSYINDDNYNDCDINKKLYCDIEGKEPMSFLERILYAKKVIRESFKDYTAEEMLQYFIDCTETGNIHYWDGIYFIHTKGMTTSDTEVYYGVRVD